MFGFTFGKLSCHLTFYSLWRKHTGCTVVESLLPKKKQKGEMTQPKGLEHGGFLKELKNVNSGQLGLCERFFFFYS